MSVNMSSFRKLWKMKLCSTCPSLLLPENWKPIFLSDMILVLCASSSSSPNNQGLHLQNLVPDFLFLFVRELPSRLAICRCAHCIMTADGYMINDVDLGRNIITEVQWSCHSQCSKHYATEWIHLQISVLEIFLPLHLESHSSDA